MSATGPTIRRGSSEQVVETPDNFIAAVERKFGPLAWDLAALPTNTKAPNYITPEQDSFTVKWHCLHSDGSIGAFNSSDHPLLWLNPPFANITPWVSKCADETAKGAEILLLVPASVGAAWYWYYVEPFADVYSVGRMKFVGHKDAYPKDLLLCHYHSSDQPKRMMRWRWQK